MRNFSNKKFTVVLLVAIIASAAIGTLISFLFPSAAPLGAVPGTIVLVWGISELSRRITKSVNHDVSDDKKSE